MLHRPPPASLRLKFDLWVVQRLGAWKTRRMARLLAMNLISEEPQIRRVLSTYGFGLLRR